jgi:hypothetical protein
MGFARIPRSWFFSIPALGQYCVEFSYTDTSAKGISQRNGAKQRRCWFEISFPLFAFL